MLAEREGATDDTGREPCSEYRVQRIRNRNCWLWPVIRTETNRSLTKYEFSRCIELLHDIVCFLGSFHPSHPLCFPPIFAPLYRQPCFRAVFLASCRVLCAVSPVPSPSLVGRPIFCQPRFVYCTFVYVRCNSFSSS